MSKPPHKAIYFLYSPETLPQALRGGPDLYFRIQECPLMPKTRNHDWPHRPLRLSVPLRETISLGDLAKTLPKVMEAGLHEANLLSVKGIRPRPKPTEEE